MGCAEGQTHGAILNTAQLEIASADLPWPLGYDYRGHGGMVDATDLGN